MTRSAASSRSPPFARPHLLAFLVGGALIVFPAVGSVALLLAVGRRAVRGVPREILATAVLVALTSAATGRVDVGMTLQIAAFGLLVAAGIVHGSAARRPVLIAGIGGVTVGLLLAAAVSVASLVPGLEGALAVVGVASVVDAAPALRRVSGWMTHPNFWGAAAIAPTTLVVALAARAHRPLWAGTALVAGLVIVLSSGSRAALLGLVVGLIGGALVTTAGRIDTPTLRRRVVVAGVGALALTLLGLAALVSADASWRARVLTLVAPPVTHAAASTNLFTASEALDDAVWWRPFVEVGRVGRDADGFAIHTLARIGGRWVDRIQQRLRFPPHEAHTLSLDLRRPGEGGADVALVGWSGAAPEPAEFVVRVPTSGPPVWYANGSVEVLAVRATIVGDDWRRLEVVFAARGAEPAAFEIGIAPRADDLAAPSPVEVRRVQIERGEVRTAYDPTRSPDRAGLAAVSSVDTRLDLYASLLRRIGERPWLGWGAHAYADVRAVSATGEFTADHEHSLPLWFALRYGIVGILAMGLLVVGSAGRDGLAWSLMAAAVVANVVDLTFFSNPFSMTLALVVGVARGAGSRVGAGGERPAAAEPGLAS